MNLKMLSKGNVLVIGDIILDKYISGTVDRVSPEAPVPVLKPLKEEIRLGGAANVALNLSSLGSRATLIGVTGKDDSSIQVSELLKRNKIQSALTKSIHPTISKLRLSASQQQLIRIDNEEDFSEEDWKSSFSKFKKHISADKNKVLVISDYGKGTLKNIPSLISEAKKYNKLILVDPKGNDFSRYKGANIITPNLLEFESVVGKIKDEPDLTKKGKALINSLNLNSLLITRGSEGMTLLESKNKKIKRSDFPTKAKDVFDVSGAGDTVIASIAAGLAGGFDLFESIRLANIAAGIVVGKTGTATVTQSEISPFYNDLSSYITINDAQYLSEGLYKEQKKIVFTNGCFDILHAGHVEYLEAAKQMGDVLIVGINSDQSVKSLKGKNRPVNKLAHRAKVLSSLSCVDKVVVFDDETPIKLIQAMKPNVLVKGGDYKVKDIVGYKEVTALGGSVVTIDLVEGLSTSKIISKLV
ncbi:bifunctional D-glycero-beta-D-manno-heptose-7-phosphate kinase/D-glycero-beta-D-manno-heptose 1-phosphate adenylyltransferase HldE [Gammaproteobacteria bacterium]|nr:bifunctional D-glycero-beta-D-manno-heptose-7-phosphate kinase/D-glycero-beta-D-manno-heptose 1-phosphate adenylyltransferase HldE [Gammaproteobacteria bacterium]